MVVSELAAHRAWCLTSQLEIFFRTVLDGATVARPLAEFEPAMNRVAVHVTISRTACWFVVHPLPLAALSSRMPCCSAYTADKIIGLSLAGFTHRRIRDTFPEHKDDRPPFSSCMVQVLKRWRAGGGHVLAAMH